MKDFNPSILILSDSTSSTVGLERKIHHMVIADTEIWPKDTTILNFSIPGTTSADALAYLRLLKSKTKKSLGSTFRPTSVEISIPRASAADCARGSGDLPM